MTRFFLLCIGILFLLTASASAQTTVSVIGPITPGDCAIFNSTTVIKDSGGTGCTGGGAGVPGGVNGSVQFNNSGSFGGLTTAQLTALVQQFTPSLSGAVPASPGGTTTFLRADGTWANPTSNIAAGAGIALTGTNPLTVATASGVDTNVLATGAVITSAPTVNSSFCGTTAALGGNAQYAFTVGAASGFAANCVLTVLNAGNWTSGRGIQLSVNGLTLSSNILYPTQVIKFRNINNAWVQDPAYQLVQPPLGQKLFLDPGGSDSNDCLATGTANACLSLGHVVMGVIWGQLLGTGGSSTGGSPTFDVRLALDSSCVPTTGASCYSGLHFSGALKQTEGNNSIMVECDGGSSTNCTIADNTGNCAIGLFNAGAHLEIKNVTLAGGNSNQCDVEVTAGRVGFEGGVVLGPTSSSSVAQLQCDGPGGQIVIDGGTGVTIGAGTSGYLALAENLCNIQMDQATFSFAGNVTYGQQTLSAISSAVIGATSITWLLNSHTVTTAHNINAATGGWVNTAGASASVPGTNSPIGTLTSAGSYN